MSEFIKKILWEAELDDDYALYQKAQKFIQRIKQLVSEFPNKYVSYNPRENFSQVKVGALVFQLFGKESYQSKLNAAAQTNARYQPRENILSLFNVDIEYDKTTKKLDISFNEKEVTHELTHFLDLKSNGSNKQKEYLKKLVPYADDYLAYCEKVGLDPASIAAQNVWIASGRKVQKEVNRDEYYNDHYELNAHFMEHIMPEVNEYISKTMEVPASFDDFKKKIFSTPLNNAEFKQFYSSLSDKNKDDLLKRIKLYYDQLKNFVVQDQHVEFNTANTTLDINRPVLDKFFSKIKGMFGKQKKAA